MFLRIFLRFAPWWVFALISFSVTPIFGWLVIDSLDERAQIIQMRDAVAPVPVPLQQLDRSQFTNPVDEIAVSGQLVGTLYGIATDTDRDVVLTMVPAEGGPVAKIAFVVDEDDVLDVLEMLGAATDQNGQTILRGTVSDSLTERTRVVQALDRSNPAFDGELIIVEPFFGARDAALNDVLTTENIGIGIGVLVIVLINGAVLLKFRASRRRRRAKKATTSAAIARPSQTLATWSSAKRAPKPAVSDPFQEGPIITIGRKM